LNCDFPANLHEYDIVIIDLQNPAKAKYSEEDHTHSQTKGHEQKALVSRFPETLFDPRAFAANILGKKLQGFLKKESIIVIFASMFEVIEYHPLLITATYEKELDPVTYSLYRFYSDLPPFKNITGRDTAVVIKTNDELNALLNRHNAEVIYRISFSHPTHWEGKRNVKDKNFFPLVEAESGGIVAFFRVENDNLTFFFPQIEQKETFLIDLLEKVLPGCMPSLFPYSTQFAWVREPLYELPNEAKLQLQEKKIQEEYETSLKEIEERIKANRQEYGFLHDLLTQTGSKLVKAVEKYLTYLGFEHIVNVDETDPELKEEDLRIESEDGLLVIEIKGIGGTSTDSDCSQIGKIKYRRSKERAAFDVFGLYLVNHQRYLPPEEREDPPFNETQIQDAKNEERGLLTTYELFKLYFNIESGLISKKDVRKALFQTGLIEFKPSESTRVPGPFEIHHKGNVVIFQVDDLNVKKGGQAILCDSRRWRLAEILDIQVDGKSVDEVNSGEVGIRLSEKVLKRTEIWLRNNPL
jgi:hypothetical protein